jgi:hypothetical protein
MQCLFCGFASSNKFIGGKEVNKEYNKLTNEMKKWSKEKNERIWIPAMLTLPEGLLYPYNDKDKMKWAYAKMVGIPKAEMEDYPKSDGGFYEQKYDVDNQEVYDTFHECVNRLNEEAKERRADEQKITLPKLKKVT